MEHHEGGGAPPAQPGPSFRFGEFLLQLPERRLLRDGIHLKLGGRAFDILAHLVRHAGQVVRHDDLVARVWPDVRVSPGTLRVHLAAVRKALGCQRNGSRFIVNVPGRGYCFVAPVRPGTPQAPPGEGQDVVAATSIHTASAERHQPAVLDGLGRNHARFASAWPERVEQLLATHNTPIAVISGKTAGRRNHAGGRESHADASAVNGSQFTPGAQEMAAAEDPDMARQKLALSAAITLLTCVADMAVPAGAATVLPSTAYVTHYRTATIGGVSLFYREAGPPTGPAVVLLHGFPTSSHMFRNLIPVLSDRYRVIAPDYPGFGQSAAPAHTEFAYTFAHYASLVDGLLQHLGVTRYAMYVMDYGAPVGYRLALLHPERVTALIVQNGNAYAEGLQAFWDPIKAYWADGSEAHRRALDFLVAPETTKFQYTDGVSDVSRISPDNWVHDQALLDRPGNRDIQLDLFHDYGSNVPLYPKFQAFFRKYQPPTLIVWGKNDKIFPAVGASPYLRDLPKAELHLLDTGHFALEDKLDVMAPMIRQFLDRSIAAE